MRSVPLDTMPFRVYAFGLNCNYGMNPSPRSCIRLPQSYRAIVIRAREQWLIKDTVRFGASLALLRIPSRLRGLVMWYTMSASSL